MKSLEYYYADGSHVVFDKYTIDTTGVVRNKKGESLTYTTNEDDYNSVTIYDSDGKTHGVRVARAIASTFLGPPPTLKHTADHKNNNSGDDTLNNVRWLCKSGQRKNQERPETYKITFIIVKDNAEKSAKDWAELLKYQKNHLGRPYTEGMIRKYAQRKHHGFAFKEYPDLLGEVWKKITDSDNKLGRWEISNMNRIKYVTKYAKNVLSGERLGLMKGYPTIMINGKQWPCHILSFMTFFPDKYVIKKPGEFVLHEDDDKMDFRPHKLRLGTRSLNATDAHDNGKYDGTKTMRVKCVSYIDGVLEKEHASLDDAVRYLKSLDYEKAQKSNIGSALNEKYEFAYGRTWELI